MVGAGKNVSKIFPAQFFSVAAAVKTPLYGAWEGKTLLHVFLKYASDYLTLKVEIESGKEVLNYSKSGLLMYNLYKIKFILFNYTVWWTLESEYNHVIMTTIKL